MNRNYIRQNITLISIVLFMVWILVNLSILLQNAMRGGATEEARDFTTQLMRQGSEANKVKNALKDTLFRFGQGFTKLH